MPAAYLAGPSAPPQGAKIECSGKEAFASPTLAREVAGRSRLRRATYRCQKCGFWHLAGGLPYQTGVNRLERKRANLVRFECVVV